MPKKPDNALEGGGPKIEFSGLNQDLVYYYNRERRLERASAAVRELNKPGPPMRGGVVRVFTTTKPLAILFLTMILLVIMTLIMSYRVSDRGGRILGENTIRASAETAGDSTFITFVKTIGGKNPYTGTVDIAVSTVLTSQEKKEGVQPPISAQRVFFTLEDEEEYRISIPFTAEELLILMQGGEQRITFRIRPE